MRDEIRRAFERASRFSPGFHTFGLYRKGEATEELGDPPEGVTKTANYRTKTVYDWFGNGAGTLVWKDADDHARTLGGEVGDGIVTLYVADPDDPPDMMQDGDGQLYHVTDALGMDVLGVAIRLRVRRWKGDAPTIRDAAP